MTLTRIKLENFTAFEQLDIELSPGINIFIGENGTGKTHLLKVAYAACDITQTKHSLADKLIRTFLPYEGRLGRLVFRTRGSSRAVAEIHRQGRKVRISFSNYAEEARSAKIRGEKAWVRSPVGSAYVPVKEMLAHAPGFRSLYASREIHFEEIYADIVDRALRPILRDPHTPLRRDLLASIQREMEGKVITKNQETFFLKNRQGDLEFTLLAEGMRKLALVWLLIQNGTLTDGSVLFWDEPEANLNPLKIGTLVEILLKLQRIGVQILLATHDYVLLKQFDLLKKDSDKVRFHSLYRDKGDKKRIRHQTTDNFLSIDPNAIADTFAELYKQDVQRALSQKGARGRRSFRKGDSSLISEPPRAWSVSTPPASRCRTGWPWSTSS